MSQRFNHYETGLYTEDDSVYPPYDHHTAYQAGRDGAILRRLEQLEYVTRQALLPRPQYPEARAVAEPALTPEPERTLWQGRPALLASVSSVLSAALWAGL